MALHDWELRALFERFADDVAFRLEVRLQPIIQQLRQKMAQIDDDIAQLTAEVASEADVVASAVKVINGIQAQITAAVQQALAAGATPDQLKAITDATAALEAQKTDLANAVAAAPQPTP